jgi:arsenate reductase
MTAHWGIADPAAVQGTEEEKRHAFLSAFRELSQRIRIFTSLPIRSLDRIKLKESLNAIGTTTSTDEVA